MTRLGIATQSPSRTDDEYSTTKLLISLILIAVKLIVVFSCFIQVIKVQQHQQHQLEELIYLVWHLPFVSPCYFYSVLLELFRVGVCCDWSKLRDTFLFKIKTYYHGSCTRNTKKDDWTACFSVK